MGSAGVAFSILSLFGTGGFFFGAILGELGGCSPSSGRNSKEGEIGHLSPRRVAIEGNPAVSDQAPLQHEKDES